MYHLLSHLRSRRPPSLFLSRKSNYSLPLSFLFSFRLIRNSTHLSSSIKMHFSSTSIFILTWTLCVLSTKASWISRRRHIHLQPRSPRNLQEPANVDGSIRALPPNITTSAAAGNLTAAGRFFQNISDSTPLVAPLYELCNIGSNHSTVPASCISALRPAPTSSCSTVLVGFYTSITVSDCSQIVTFSTKNGYSIVSATASPTATPFLRARQERQDASAPTQEESPQIQKLRTYYAAPWQAVAANDPKDIEVKTCKVNEEDIDESCETDTRKYVLATKYREVTVTSTVSASTTLSSVRLSTSSPSWNFHSCDNIGNPSSSSSRRNHQRPSRSNGTFH